MTTDSQAGIPSSQTTDRSIATYFRDGELLKFKDKETIICDADQPEGVFLIKSGFVKAYSISPAGHNNLFFIHQAGEFIPLPWALDGAHATGLSYEALDKVSVLKVPKGNLRKAMGHDAWLSQDILKQAVEVIAVYTQRIQTLEFRSARERLISEILNLAERFGHKNGKEVSINVPLTHQDLANSINMNRETASRTLGMLVEEGLISQSDHLLSILDLPKFQKALG